MRCSVIDSNYRTAAHKGMAASWLDWELNRLESPPVGPSDAEVYLVTVSSQQGIGAVRSALRHLPRRPTVLGGGGCFAPAVFDAVADVCCVGEGRTFLRTLIEQGLSAAQALPNAWCPGETRSVVPDTEFPWDIPPIKHPDGTVRLMAARGCRSRCLFCQTGWEQAYTPNPNPDGLALQARALSAAGSRVALVTNDGTDDVAAGVDSEFLSVKMAGLPTLFARGLDRRKTRTLRFGIEGVSERLRTAVGKPLSTTQIVDGCRALFERGIGVKLFFIAGLPCESDSDWHELRELVNGIRHAERGCAMMVFHAFIPQPATPLGVLPLEDNYWEPFEEFRRWFFHGPGFTRRVQILPPAKYPGRLERAQESMAASVDELRTGWFDRDNANWRIRYAGTPTMLRRLAREYRTRLSPRSRPAG